MGSRRQAPSLTLTALIGGIAVCFALGLVFLRAMKDSAESAQANLILPETTIRLVDNSGTVTAVVSWQQTHGGPIKDLRLQSFTVDGTPPKDQLPRQIPTPYEGRSLRLDFPTVPSTKKEDYRVNWALQADGNVRTNTTKLSVDRS